ncbi:ABC transporter substrate-binding protein [Sulfuricurvum sp.]|uniref:ABC transporter substrate-binding protein n=3 Tax=Sulfuricurvum sp. TaxID=2025608 RepID=UPI0026040A85|nr:ABC transporter substrate-binding protein [Sulfuricurvum sp.]MDD2265681.1 ABC transporter substrate-binding protein [Sulfuricurvum sp.]HZF71556.1 ABC transporter substrate-binding protein [Sulfuricurvum sp.]
MKKLLLLLLFFMSVAWSRESVTLQLSWLNQFQFAGYYVAKENGYYSDAGLDVTILDAQNRQDPFDAVMKGKAQYGVGRSSLIVDYINGAPLVLMAAVFQSSPMMLLTRKDSNITKAQDLKNKRVMLTGDTVEGAEMQAMLRSVGLRTTDLYVQKHSYDPMSLARRDTDAMVAYLSNEPYILQKAGIETHAIHPKDYGFDFYSDILFTTKKETLEHPQRAEAFYDASMRGWLWAFDHIEETAELIYRNYNPQHKSLDALIYEGRVLKELAFRPNTAFGSIEPIRLEMIAQGYRLMGVVPSIPSFDPLIYKHSTLNLTAKEKAWLKAHPVVRVGVDQNWPPVESIDEKGRHIGISASYLSLLEKRLGIHFEVDYSRRLWSDSLRAVQNKDLDMLSCAAITEKRQENLVFSRSYLKQSMVIVADSGVGYVNDLNDLNGKKVAVVRSYASEEILRKYYPKIIPVLADSSLEALKKVASGEAYACVEGLGTVSYLIEHYNLKRLKVVGETPYRYELAFAFRNDWGMLASISDKVLASITQSEYQAIHGSWLVMEKNEPINYSLVWGIAGFMGVLFIVIAYKNRRLDVLVRQRTDELETFNQRLQEEIEKAVEKNRKQEKLLMQQAKMAEIGSMLESIAHQWRQPLNILGLSMTRLNLSCSIGGSQEAAKVIEIAEAQIEYMSQTIDDFRNFFKHDRDQISVNINTLISDVEALLGPLLVRKKITIERDIDPDTEVLVYPNELKQVLINLINNAREAIEQHRGDKRVIYIRCQNDEKYCTISVEDTGGGIPNKIIDKIFDPYFTTKFESQGTGIGLYMAKTIIEKHFLGKLSVYNSNLGACFEIRLNRSLKAGSGTLG